MLVFAAIFKRDTSQYLKKKYDAEQMRLTKKFNISMETPKNGKGGKKQGDKNNLSHQNFSVGGSSSYFNNHPQDMNQGAYNQNFMPNPMQNNMPNSYGSQQYMGSNNPQYNTDSVYSQNGNMPLQGSYNSQNKGHAYSHQHMSKNHLIAIQN